MTEIFPESIKDLRVLFLMNRCMTGVSTTAVMKYPIKRPPRKSRTLDAQNLMKNALKKPRMDDNIFATRKINRARQILILKPKNLLINK